MTHQSKEEYYLETVRLIIRGASYNFPRYYLFQELDPIQLIINQININHTMCELLNSNNTIDYIKIYKNRNTNGAIIEFNYER